MRTHVRMHAAPTHTQIQQQHSTHNDASGLKFKSLCLIKFPKQIAGLSDQEFLGHVQQVDSVGRSAVFLFLRAHACVYVCVRECVLSSHSHDSEYTF